MLRTDSKTQSEVKGYYSQLRPEILKYIPESSKTIIDVGCGNGSFAEQLKTGRGCEVWGIEINPEAGKTASQKLDKVFVGDVFEYVEKLPDNYFDCIVFNDILEHLIDPYRLIEMVKTKLSPQGIVIASIPNVRYYSTFKNLVLYRQWHYEDFGVLDRTHLRFFTDKSIKELFCNAGYEVLSLKGINPIKSGKLTLINILTFGHFSDSRYLQFVCVAKPKK